MQAIYLVEVYSIFKSRRPPLQLSKIFQEVYQTLASDISAMAGNTSDSIHSGAVGYVDDMAFLIDAKCKQRLLLACYILDQQHSTLFGRSKTPCYSGAGTDLPLPWTQVSWDSTLGQHGETTTQSRVWEAIDISTLDESAQQSYDVFQSMLMMACLGDGADFDNSEYATNDDTFTSPMSSKMEQSPRVKMAYHAFMLCKNTPIRDLLAVAGESWVMAEKLSNQAEYTAAQIETRRWARGNPNSARFDTDPGRAPVTMAMGHALKILELHLNHPKTGLLFQEWSVYLASVVLWARAHVTASKLEQGRRLSVAIAPERRRSLQDLDQELPSVIAAATKGEVGLEQAKTVLLWAKARIEKVDIPHNCGLTNGALDVLGKLIARGSEDGWFGS